MTRGLLVAAQAEHWIDVPFVWQGRVRAGCDCKGLVAGVAAELELPEAQSLAALAADYGDTVPVARLTAGLADLFDPVPPAAPLQPGDVLQLTYWGRAQHLAIHCPSLANPERAIEAKVPVRGPGRVRPCTWPRSSVAAAWRWREGVA